jgi:hypothetical protein
MNRADHCPNTTGPIGCPDEDVRLICFRFRWHAGDCYDAMAHIWWRRKRPGENEPPMPETTLQEAAR